MKKLIIIGGGAAGCFLAANSKSKNWEIIILEQSKNPLQKLKISGGGRCNVTNACFSPKKLVTFYPRGYKELVSVFNQFQPQDVFEWFLQKGINLKTEEDNRVFPETDSSQTIINTFTNEIIKNNIQIFTQTTVLNITKIGAQFEIHTTDQTFLSDALVIATGSAPNMWKILHQLGHKIIHPVPSLFTFVCNDPVINNLQGISFPKAELHIPSLSMKEQGPLLITHWGVSGPAILKLSSWSARELYALNYKFTLRVNWISENYDTVRDKIIFEKQRHPKKFLYPLKLFNFTQRFWKSLLIQLHINDKKLVELSKTDINKIADAITNTSLSINGKSNYKNEFVTAGGVDLKEIDFKTMQSKLIPNLFFAGEVLNIDAITGGFNFQACWSEAYILSQHFNTME